MVTFLIVLAIIFLIGLIGGGGPYLYYKLLAKKDEKRINDGNEPLSNEEVAIKTINIFIIIITILLVGVAVAIVLIGYGASIAEENFTICGVGIVFFFVFNVILGFLSGKLSKTLSGIDNYADRFTGFDKGFFTNAVSGCFGTIIIAFVQAIVGLFYGLSGWLLAIIRIAKFLEVKKSLKKTIFDNKAKAANNSKKCTEENHM